MSCCPGVHLRLSGRPFVGVTGSRYIMRGGLGGRERLRVLSRTMGPPTAGLLSRIDISPGARCLDVGCGGGDVTLKLASLVGDEGEVVGIDMDPSKLEIARAEAADAGVTNVHYRELRIEDLDEHEAFDLAYTRFVLTHLSRPEDALRAMIAAVRPGGTVAVEDVDMTGRFCHPPSAAFDRYEDLYCSTARARGGDPDIGRRLPLMFLDAGLAGIAARIEQPLGFDRDIKLMTPLTLEMVADAMVEEGLAAREELDALMEDLYALVDDPRTILTFPRVVQVWANRPFPLD
jgi:SAM-dependent methyltransferase